MRRAFLVGCGYTGGVLAAHLQRRGIPVAGTSLHGAGPAGVPLQAVDLRAPESVAALDPRPAEGAVLYYLVATLARDLDPVARPHLAALERLLARLAAVPLAGLVYLSSTSVYGDQDGGWVDEQTAPAPTSPWGQMRLELEERIRREGQARGVPACVTRLPEIYGPGRGPLQRLRSGYGVRHPERWSNRVHVEDLAEVLVLLGERLEPELLLVSDSQPAPSGEVFAAAAALLGLPGVPAAAAGEELDANRLALTRDSKRCSNARLLAWLDRPLRYPSYREGLPASL